MRKNGTKERKTEKKERRQGGSEEEADKLDILYTAQILGAGNV